jgi:phage shock protein PspC (stress-responsive transcriptional regulator)
MSLFETTMLVCFGVSWPVSIAKSWRTKKVSGKSPVFLVIVILGYAAGIAHKLFYSPDLVLALYVVNFCMVTIDLALYWYLSRAQRCALSEPVMLRGETCEELDAVEMKSEVLAINREERKASGQWQTHAHEYNTPSEIVTRKTKKRRARG